MFVSAVNNDGWYREIAMSLSLLAVTVVDDSHCDFISSFFAETINEAN